MTASPSSQEEARELKAVDLDLVREWHDEAVELGYSKMHIPTEWVTALLAAARPTPDLGDVDELVARATRISPVIEREDRSDGTERYVVRGVPCGFPVAKFGDYNDAALFVFAATKLADTIIALRAALDKND